MPEDIASMIILLLFVGIGIWAMVRALSRTVKNRKAPIKSVKAEIINKQITEPFSKYSGSGKNEKHVITFSAEGKKLSFYVSAFSYNGYKVGEKGVLKYKGDRIIAFK